jgi:tubulin monoglycylase TTLL3/8
MVDTSSNVWLLEVNSSPSMEYSSPITNRMVKEVLHNLAEMAVI